MSPRQPPRSTPILPLLLLACASPDPAWVGLRPAGLEVRGAEISRVLVRDPDGVELIAERPPAPVERLSLRLPWPGPGQYAVEVRSAAGVEQLTLDVPAALPRMDLSLEAPVGQGAQEVADGEAVSVLVIDGRPTPVAATLTAWADGTARLSIGGDATEQPVRMGERLRMEATFDAPATLVAELAGERRVVSLSPAPVEAEALAAQLQVSAVRFPATPDGGLDVGRPEGRVTLPAPWWRQLQRAAGLGFRGQDPWAPWGWTGVEVENQGDEAINVVVRVQLLDEAGAAAEVFRPRLRGGDDGTGAVRALLRVPAKGRATAALPLFVDEPGLSGHDAAEGRWTRVVDVLPLGAPEAVARVEAPLYVSRGSAAASAGLAAALLSALLGLGLLAARGPRWLERAATSELMTIALFGALTFLVGTAGQLLSMGFSALLGPFAILATGLIDDTLRYALLATLLTLLPRPGTAALTVITAWLLSGVALGSISPTDLLFLGSRVLFLEGALYLVGITRSDAWLARSRVIRWAMLSLAFGGASALSTLTGLSLHMALYRLYYADWYVAMLVLGPGLLYEALACAVAVPFAESLRGIQR